MKLERISTSELANADLNEWEMCRLVGGGYPRCYQCGCHYSSTTATNNTPNNKDGLTSDPRAQPCDCPASPPPQDQCTITFKLPPIYEPKVDNSCPGSQRGVDIKKFINRDCLNHIYLIIWKF